MKTTTVAALALAALPALMSAHAASITIDFEKDWDYANGDIDGYYAGGTAADGSSGPNLGAQFVNVSGLSNDALGPYYSGAPSMQGVAYAHVANPGDRATLTLGSASQGLGFFYASPVDVAGAVLAFDAAGTQIASIDLKADSSSAYDGWSYLRFDAPGAVRFDFTGAAGVVAFDNLSTVPEPASLLLAATAAAAALVRRRRA